MKIIKRIESRERCAESGWYAWDYLLDQPMDKEFILSLKPLGGFVYLPMLKKPFFKIEGEHFLIKGVEQETYLRMAVHQEHQEELELAEELIRKAGKTQDS